MPGLQFPLALHVQAVVWLPLAFAWTGSSVVLSLEFAESVPPVSASQEGVRGEVLGWFGAWACNVSMGMLGGLVLEQEPGDSLVQLCVVLCCFLFACFVFRFWLSSVFPGVHVDGLVFDSSLVTPLPQLCMGYACWGRSVGAHSLSLLPSLSSMLAVAG